ncbi:MAG: TonB-dependent receptor [Gammaproteobacteria bacterium]|nr:TonB-dependent receptor [Gammaproteobacteria bacterium]
MKTHLKLITSSVLLSMMAGAAAPAFAQGAVLEEIIVTAAKREQNIRDVAATVNVVTGAQLDDYSILNFKDIERITSGISLTQKNPRNNTISMRGVVVDPESGTGAAVDVYQNDVPQRADNIFGAIYDMNRVEVLRGPQGSVQGATSPAGAIILHTTKPSLDGISGYVQADYGEGNSAFNLQGAVNLPLVTDKLGLRIAAYDDRSDGTNIVNIGTGNVQETSSTSFRASLLWRPTENLEFSLVHQDNDELLMGTPAVVGSRSAAAGFRGVPGIPCSIIQGFGVGGPGCTTLTAEDNSALAADDAFSTRDAQITTLNMDWDIGENHQLSYVYGRTDSEKVSRTENDISSNFALSQAFLQFGLGVQSDTDYLTHQGTTTVVDADVHELRISSVDNPVWNYMFGVFYRDQKTSTRFQSFSTSASFLPLGAVANSPFSPIVFTGGHIEGINFATGGTIPFNTKNEAIFTSHSFQLSEKTVLEAAIRLQDVEGFNTTDILFDGLQQPERISIQGVQAFSLTPLIPPAAVPSVANGIAQQVLQGTLAALRGINIESIPPEFQRRESDSTTGSISLRHDFSDETTAYIAYSRSFRPGGISVTPGSPLGAGDLLYGDEESDNIEIGTKMVYLDGALEVNTALYKQDFDGFLLFTRNLDFVAPDGSVQALTGGLVSNANATFSGVDLDWRAALSERWRAGGGISYVKAELDNASVPCNIRQPGQQVGRCSSSSRVPGAPELTANIFAEYARPWGDMEFFARGNAKYNGGIVATRAVEFGTSPGETDSYNLVDLFMGVRQENWEVSVWAKNLFDEDANLDLSNPGDNFDFNGDFREVFLLPPRSFGLSARMDF